MTHLAFQSTDVSFLWHVVAELEYLFWFWLEQLSICSEDCWFEERGAVKSCNSISAGQHQHGKASLNWLTHTLTWDITRTTVYHSCHMCFRRYQQHSTGTGLFCLKIWLVESERTQRQQEWQPTSGFGLKTEQVTTDGTRLPRMSSPALWSYSYIVVRQILLLRSLRPQAALIRLGWRGLSLYQSCKHQFLCTTWKVEEYPFDHSISVFNRFHRIKSSFFF